MTFKTKLPIKKSKDEIKFYQTNGINFSMILLQLRMYILSEQITNSSELIDRYYQLCLEKFILDYSFPFKNQKNPYDITFNQPICISVNDCIAHGKSTEKFKYNDIISLDFGLALPYKDKFLNFDAAYTIQISQEETWINESHNALKNIIKNQPKNTYELGSVIEETAYKANLSNIVSLTGHGIGYNLHEPPVIHNAKGNYQSDELFEGLCFCAEPIFGKRKGNNNIEKTYIDSDGWSIFTQSGVPTSHFETMFCIINSQIVDLLKMTEWSI